MRGAVRPLAMAVTVARRQAQGSMAFFLQVSTRKAMRAPGSATLLMTGKEAVLALVLSSA